MQNRHVEARRDPPDREKKEDAADIVLYIFLITSRFNLRFNKGLLAFRAAIIIDDYFFRNVACT